MGSSKKSCRSAIASMSLGRAFAGHDLMFKLKQAAEAGFEGIEIFYEDLECEAKIIVLGRQESSDDGITPSTENLLAASKGIKNKCYELGVVTIGLQTFLFYEGLTDRKQPPFTVSVDGQLSYN